MSLQHTVGVASKTSLSIRSYGNLPTNFPFKLVMKFTQCPSCRFVPSRRISFTSKPNWRHSSSERGERAWALGASRRVGYRSIIRDGTVLSLLVLVHIALLYLNERECVPPNCASMYPSVNPEGPPPMIRMGTLSDCSMVGVLLYAVWSLYIDIFNSVGIVHKKLHKAQDACYISLTSPHRWDESGKSFSPRGVGMAYIYNH